MNLIKKVVAAAVISVACSNAMASSVICSTSCNLESGNTYTANTGIPVPGEIQINVGSGVTGAIFRLEDTINDWYTVSYQLYDNTMTAVGDSWTFTDLGGEAENLAQTGVYRALTSGSTYYLKLAFVNLPENAKAFGATTNISAVPLPAAAWLFGSALLGLGALRRKQKAGVNTGMAAA